MATGRRENHRENIAGRANVEDTPELLAYYDELEDLEAGALWTVANKIEPWQPQSSSIPVLWRYEDLRKHVLRSVELVSPEKAGRRVGAETFGSLGEDRLAGERRQWRLL